MSHNLMALLPLHGHAGGGQVSLEAIQASVLRQCSLSGQHGACYHVSRRERVNLGPDNDIDTSIRCTSSYLYLGGSLDPHLVLLVPLGDAVSGPVAIVRLEPLRERNIVGARVAHDDVRRAGLWGRELRVNGGCEGVDPLLSATPLVVRPTSGYSGCAFQSMALHTPQKLRLAVKYSLGLSSSSNVLTTWYSLSSAQASC